MVRKFFGWAVMSAFLGMLALGLGVFSPMLFCFSPFMAISMVRDPKSLKPSRLSPGMVRLLVLVLFPLFFAALLAPFRAMAVLGIHVLHLFRPLALGPSLNFLPAWLPKSLDAFQGIVGICFGLFGAAYDGYWRYRLTQEIAGIPTAKIRSVAVGLAELRGIVRREQTDPTTGPLVEFSASLERVAPFYLEDETGRILIDPQGARVRRRNSFKFGGRFSETVLTKRISEPSLLGTPRQGRLLEGDSLYALGYVEKNSIPDPSAPYVLRCKKPTFFESDVRNLFFLTDAQDASAREAILQGLYSVLFAGAFWIALSTLLIAVTLQ